MQHAPGPGVRLSGLPLAVVLLLFVLPGFILADIQFPKLSGRVVDEAGLLSAQEKTHLSSRLESLESASTHQIVVVTVPSLQGYDIAEYGLELGRLWGIGQEGEDNGALLIVAPEDRKVRIEVGYGLEAYLTDAVSHSIIRREILPAFRSGNYPLGISRGVDAMIAALQGSYSAQRPEDRRDGSRDIGGFLPLIFLAIVAISELLKRHISHGIAGNAAFSSIAGIMATLVFQSILIGILAAIAVFVLVTLFGSGGGGSGPSGRIRRRGRGVYYGGSGGFGGGGGFSGGGGGFGGGGASGGW